MTYSSMHSLTSEPTQRADHLLSALRGRDQKSLAQILSDPKKVPTLLQQWDRLVANARTTAIVETDLCAYGTHEREIVVGKQSSLRGTLATVEYEAKF